MKISIDDVVWVKPTEIAIEILRKHFYDLIPNCTPEVFEQNTAGYREANGWYRFQLGDLMNIFGHHWTIGPPTLFVDREIYLASPNTVPSSS